MQIYGLTINVEKNGFNKQLSQIWGVKTTKTHSWNEITFTSFHFDSVNYSIKVPF